MQPEEYGVMFRAEETHWWYHALHQLIFQTLESEVPDWRGKKTLDAGCGTGSILKRLGNPAKNVGVDLAPEAVSFCQQRGLTNVQRANICALPFVNASFDVVVCSSVLYHQWVEDPAAAVRELHRVLRPGGLLLLNVPALRFLHSAHDEAVMTAHRFSKSEIRQLLRDNGFAICRLTYWTTLLFPLAVIARTLGGSATGRDFHFAADSLPNRLFTRIMALELRLLKRASLPIGVALLAAARKQAPGKRNGS
ncbi:MAG TPA: methyltransferase domain-containing protein [Candidatus Udaeobacter sp.]|nr:methyltransferase domain-containing protein [Candidatus Udaeobacter sp.]